MSVNKADFDIFVRDVGERMTRLRFTAAVLIVALIVQYFFWKRDENKLEGLQEGVAGICLVAMRPFAEHGYFTLGEAQLLDRERPGASDYISATQYVPTECELDDALRAALEGSPAESLIASPQRTP